MSTITTRDELIAKFEEIDKSYTVFYAAIYPDISLERKEYTEKTEEEIAALAAELLQGQSAESDVLLAEKTAILAGFSEKESAAAENRDAHVSRLQQDYDAALSELAEDVLQRNLQKSVWYLAEKERLRQKKEDKVANESAQYEAELRKIGEERVRTAAAYDAKIARAGAQHLAAVAEMKRTLSEAERKISDALLEYNNEQTMEEVKYNKSAMDSVFERANESTVTRASMMFEKLRACYEYLDTFPATEALGYAQDDHIYSKYLGSFGQKELANYYQRLVDSQRDY